MSRQYVINQLEAQISELVESGKLCGKKVYLFGLNPYTEAIINMLYEKGKIVEAILDNSKQQQGKRVAFVQVISPETICYEQDSVVLIASQHIDAMRKQLENYACEVYSLFDFKKYNFELNEKKKFWHESNFEEEMSRLEQGKVIYDNIIQAEEMLIISPTISIGDNFLWELSFTEYKEKKNIGNYKVVVASKGAYKVVGLFGENKVVQISKEQMDLLLKYVMLLGEKTLNCLVVYPRYFSQRCLDIIASWHQMTWEEIYPKYIFQLNADYQLKFPPIHKKYEELNRLKELGICEKKAVILSPYANTVGELPILFWEKLVEELVTKKYCVLTNVVGKQQPIKGSQGIDIPLNEIASYLEYAGYFIGLRNGICDIIGKANCCQIVLFRDRKQLHTSEMVFNNLHIDDVAPNARYVIYDEENIDVNVKQVLECMNC